MQNKNDIFVMLKDLLVEEFEIPAQDITLEAQLYEELDLDSIDAVDLVVKLREITGVKIAPESFKQVRTISDIVDALETIAA
jgi:acyl carrier protein